MINYKPGKALRAEVLGFSAVTAGDDVTSTLCPSVKDEVRTFTGTKLDTLNLACADSAIQSFDFRILFAIAKHLNVKSGVAHVSDQTIADEAASSRRNVIRGRKRLKQRGWLSWRRTRGANVYWLVRTRENEILDNLISYKEDRQKQRENGLNNRRRVPRLSQEKPTVVTVRSPQEAPTGAPQAVTASSPKHLLSNTESPTPFSEGLHPETAIVEGPDSMPDIPAFLDRRVRR